VNALNGAAGEADKFSKGHLDNLAGQLDLLSSAWKTLRVEIGTTFGPATRGIVESMLFIVRGIGRVLKDMSPETAKTLGTTALAVGALVAAFGAFAGLKLGIAGMSAVMRMLGVSLLSVLLGFLPLIGIFAVAAAAGYMLYRAYKANFGGIADFLDTTVHRISLGVSGLAQLFSNSALSGDTMKGLNKDKGLKEFVVTIWGWGEKLINFFRGIGAGFTAVKAQLEPVFRLLLYAFGQLGSLLGITRGSAEENASTFDKFGQAGKDVGRILAGVLAAGIRFLTWSIQALTIVVGAGKDAWVLWGSSLGGVFDILGGSLQILFGLLTGNGNLFWRGFINLTIGSVKTVVNALYGMAKGIAYVIDIMNHALSIDSNWVGSVQEKQARMIGGLDESALYWKRQFLGEKEPAVAQPVNSLLTPAAAAAAEKGVNSVPVSAVSGMAAAGQGGQQELLAALNKMVAIMQANKDVPVHTQVLMNEDVLMSAVSRGQRGDKARSYQGDSSGAVE
jgi:hypothetical protein